MTDTILIAFLFSLAAGLSTGLGSLVAFFIKHFKHSYLSLLMGVSAGVLIQISFMELLFTAVTETGFLNANIAFFLGIATITSIEFLIPHEYKEEKLTDKEKKSRRLMKTGILVSTGIVIHNFPEGIVTLFGAMKERSSWAGIADRHCPPQHTRRNLCRSQSTTQQKTEKKHSYGLFSQDSLSQSEQS